ncbi:MAG: hypothetical protein IT462_06885 [Planctomycetes bacterium]|nr:hypothetical protein [Planctomycetota bacterium]
MSNVEYKAPGPGVWELEQTHFAKPTTRYVSEVFADPLWRGFGEGTRRYGLLLNSLKMRWVNDFCYGKFMPVGAPEGAKGLPPKFIFKLMTWLHPEMRSRIKQGTTTVQKKIWREDMKRWDEHYKPDSIARNSKLQNTEIEKLSDADFLAYLKEVRDNAIEMVYRHHIFTITCCYPTGLFLSKVMLWTCLPSGEILGVLKGAAPISRGLATRELEAIWAALPASGLDLNVLRAKSADQVLNELKSRNDNLGKAAREYLDLVSYRLVSGYDVSEKYALEMPEMLAATILGGKPDVTDREADFKKRRDALRAKVPAEHHAEFDMLLEESRFIHRLRDERGMYNDLWGSGLARRAILEAGRRLKERGVLPDASLAVNASHTELVAMLKGEPGPDAAELKRRQEWRETKTVADAPAYLGGAPSGPPPLAWLPEKARDNARAIDTVIKEIFHVPERKAAAKACEGMAVHPGIYEGIARLINGPADFNRLQKGDVLVTRNTSPAFNVVLPLIGAIVTDRGGQLSHAAIVAREYGIPCVVGTCEATKKIVDGSRVRVNGDKGLVELLG